MRLHNRNVHWLWLSAVVILLDQVAKQLIVRELQWFEVRPLIPHLNLTHMQNKGAAFSMFNQAPAAVFVLLGVAVSIGILVWLRKNPVGQTMMAAGLSLILAGALGNVIDRVTRGYVVDFIDFYIGNWHFAAFNVADTAISIGAGLLILDSLLDMVRHRHHERPTGG